MMFRLNRLGKVALLLGCVGIVWIIPEVTSRPNTAEAFQPRPSGGSRPRTNSSSSSSSRPRSSTPPRNVKVSSSRPVSKSPSLFARVGNAVRSLFRSRATSQKVAPIIVGNDRPIGKYARLNQNSYGEQQPAYQANPYLYNNGNVANPLSNNFGGAWNMPGANAVGYYGNNLPANHGFYSSFSPPNGGAMHFRQVQNLPVSNQGLQYGVMASSPGGMPQFWSQGPGLAPRNPAVNNIPPQKVMPSPFFHQFPPERSQYALAPSRAIIQKLPGPPQPEITYSQLPANPQAAPAKNLSTKRVRFAEGRALASDAMTGNPRANSGFIGPVSKPAIRTNTNPPRPNTGPPVNNPPATGNNPPATGTGQPGTKPPPKPPRPKI